MFSINFSSPEQLRTDNKLNKILNVPNLSLYSKKLKMICCCISCSCISCGTCTIYLLIWARIARMSLEVKSILEKNQESSNFFSMEGFHLSKDFRKRIKHLKLISLITGHNQAYIAILLYSPVFDK